MKDVDFEMMKLIRAEVKAEGREYRKMVFHKKSEEEDSEEVLDTKDAFEQRFKDFADDYKPSKELIEWIK